MSATDRGGPADRAVPGNNSVSTSSTLNNTPEDTPSQSRSPSRERRKLGAMDSQLSSEGPTKSSKRSLARYLNQEMEETGMGMVIVVCFFTSGMIDAVAFNSWNCFVGMQTGNTVFAALGISGQPRASHREQYYKSLIAIAAFVAGTIFFNFFHRYVTGLSNQPVSRRRSIFAFSFFVQTLFIVAAGGLVQTGVVSNQPYISGTFSSGSHLQQVGPNPLYLDFCPIALLSFQAAGQVALSRVLGLIELPTIVLSTLFHDFTSDVYTTAALWRSSSSAWDFVSNTARRQEKRLASIIALFLGALVGGELYKSRGGMCASLWFAAAIKLAITFAWLVWKGEKATPDDEEQALPT